MEKTANSIKMSVPKHKTKKRRFLTFFWPINFQSDDEYKICFESYDIQEHFHEFGEMRYCICQISSKNIQEHAKNIQEHALNLISFINQNVE